MSATAPLLVIGYGNPGRGDDGLGPACVDAVARLRLDGVRCEQDYQPAIEDAVDVAAARAVIFVDAARSGPAPYFVRPVRPRERLGFTSHVLDAEGVMAIAARTFGATPPAWKVGIRGETFEAFCERISPRALGNLACAVAFLEAALTGGRPEETLARAAREGPEGPPIEAGECAR